MAVAAVDRLTLCVQQLDPAETAIDGFAEEELQAARRVIQLRPRRRVGALEIRVGQRGPRQERQQRQRSNGDQKPLAQQGGFAR